MTDHITLQISGESEAVLRLLNGLKQPEAKSEQPQPQWKIETPWFERHGKLTAEEAADMEVGLRKAEVRLMQHTAEGERMKSYLIIEALWTALVGTVLTCVIILALVA